MRHFEFFPKFFHRQVFDIDILVIQRGVVAIEEN